MTPENYSKICCLDFCLAVASFNLLEDKEMKKCFKRINFRQMYVKDNIIKDDKVDHYLYLLQKVKVKYFLRINEEGLN